MLTISLLKEKSHFSVAFAKKYARFKHGSKTQAREFGVQLGKLLNKQEFLKNHKNIIIYSAPFNNIPTASNALKDYALSIMTKSIEENKVTVREGKIFREYSYDSDYGNMSKEERQKVIAQESFYMDKNFVKPDDLLIFFDDIKITGAHEDNIVTLLKREDITNPVIFVYYAQYLGTDPTIENRLNYHGIKKLIDIGNIIRNEEFIFNTRVIKFILKQNYIEFYEFIKYQSKTFLETLHSSAILNGYHSNKLYKVNFNILKKFLKNELK